MAQGKASRFFDRIDQWEFSICRSINRATRYPLMKSYFRTVSRLGDGWIWYAIILLLPVFQGPSGWALAATMTIAGLACTLMYKGLKRKLVRERPFISFPAISCAIPPLDRYSFPSGHTLHAVCFTTLLFTFMPTLGLLVLPFTLSVMASRVILGLHYPSDVAAGAVIGLIGGLLASLMLPTAMGMIPV